MYVGSLVQPGHRKESPTGPSLYEAYRTGGASSVRSGLDFDCRGCRGDPLQPKVKSGATSTVEPARAVEFCMPNRTRGSVRAVSLRGMLIRPKIRSPHLCTTPGAPARVWGSCSYVFGESIMSDPQRCEGGPSALALVAAWMHPCTCSHPQIEHEIVDVGKRKGERSWCTRATARGMCGCTIFTPAPEPSGVT